MSADESRVERRASGGRVVARRYDVGRGSVGERCGGGMGVQTALEPGVRVDAGRAISDHSHAG